MGRGDLVLRALSLFALAGAFQPIFVPWLCRLRRVLGSEGVFVDEFSLRGSGTNGISLSQNVSSVLLVHVYCGNFTGTPKWQGLDYYEPDECNWEGDIEIDSEEYEPPENWRKMAAFTCGGCGARNLVTDHESLP